MIVGDFWLVAAVFFCLSSSLLSIILHGPCTLPRARGASAT